MEALEVVVGRLDMVVRSIGCELVEAALQVTEDGAVAFEFGTKIAECGGEGVTFASRTAPQLLDRVDDVGIEASVLLALRTDRGKLVGRRIAAGGLNDWSGTRGSNPRLSAWESRRTPSSDGYLRVNTDDDLTPGIPFQPVSTRE